MTLTSPEEGARNWAILDNELALIYQSKKTKAIAVGKKSSTAVIHGKASSYTHHRCRCEPCTNANRLSVLTWRLRKVSSEIQQLNTKQQAQTPHNEAQASRQRTNGTQMAPTVTRAA